ncbi:MAG: DNA polymerase Y family protein [Planctomycetia bacterium]|nr:DNA polymerase Y family protein [Planctomycetia bacterium]
MSRIMTIWLPRWPVQRRLIESPALRKVPVFICRRERRGVMTIVSWAWVLPPRSVPVHAGERRAAPRIPPGMSLAEGMAVLALAHGSRACQMAEIAADDPAADRAALERLARYSRRFAPIVALEDVERPECIHIDVTGTAGFFGGEEALVHTAVWTLAARGIHARVAIADTPGAAWAAAHHTEQLDDRHRLPPFRRPRRFAVVPPGGQAAALAALPASALRLDAAVLAALREVGIDSIGGILKLSRNSLASRFSPTLAVRLAQFTGARAEPLAPTFDEELPRSAQAFDVPMSLREMGEDAVAAILERLVLRCMSPLTARGEGVTSLQVRFEQWAGAVEREPTPPVVIDVGLYRPSVAVRHVVELVRLRMSRVRLPREIEGVAVEVVATAPALCRQRTLFAAERESAAAEVGMLFDRLAGRLGTKAVFEPQVVNDAQPEHAWLGVPPGGQSGRMTRVHGSGSGSATTQGRQAVPAERRPIWMLARPVPLDVMAVVPAVADAGRPPVRFRWSGEAHEVTVAHGPERIETAWWRGPIVRRDYYVVETQTGERFWIFRRLKDGGWFLHGVFA